MADRAAAQLHPRGPSVLDDQHDRDLLEVWPAMLAIARHIVERRPALRPARPTDSALHEVLADALSVPASPGPIRAFLAEAFRPFPADSPGFLTGYYEPVVEASPVRTDRFIAPVLPRPPDLVDIAPGGEAGQPSGVTAGRRRPDGTLEPYPDRAAIEAGALDGLVEPILWLRDWVELFLVQVQGSARVRLPDGTEQRLVYAGRNGQPYTSVGRFLIDTGRIASDAMSLDALKTWLRANGQAVGDGGRAALQRNRSTIFFRLAPSDPAIGPIGGAGVPLTPRRSVAIDRARWPYGLPVVIETDEAVPGFGPMPLRRLFVAQDTGSAIVGPARIDLFLGSGDAAGRHAGRIRHPGRVTLLLPRG